MANELKQPISPQAIVMEPEKYIVAPKEVPVLAVRDTVLFPHAVLPLTIGRESSIEMIRSLGE